MKQKLLILLLLSLLLLPIPARCNRYMWTWTTSSITNNLGTAQSQFFSFCTAPFGDSSLAVKYIYYYADPDVNTNQANLRSFLSTAHSLGFTVLYLDGDATWAQNGSGMAQAEKLTGQVLTFNLGGTSTQRFDGIEYDIEPYSLSGWSSNKATYWGNYTTLLAICQASVNQYNSSTTPSIYFEVTIPYWYDNPSGPGGGVTSNKAVQSIVDSVAILDYNISSTQIFSQATDQLTIGTTYNKKVVVGFETGNYVPSVETFYGLGVPYMEAVLTTCQSGFSKYSSFQGFVIEDYDTYTAMFIQGSSSPFLGGIIWDFDSTATSPTTIRREGFYIYTYTSTENNTKGIGGSNALQISFPFESNRYSGAGFDLENANTLNLSSCTTIYWSIMASETCNLGVAFAVYDTSGNMFIPAGAYYIQSSTQLKGSISTTTFQQLNWNVRNFHVYKAGHDTGAAPDLSQITRFEFFFPTTDYVGSGGGAKWSGLNFYLDNVGATGPGPGSTPVELWNFEAIESQGH
jgi:hypothetical protein